MICFRNYSGRRLKTLDEEMRFVRAAEGEKDKDGSPFEIITLKLKTNGQPHYSVKGAQDTVFILGREGNTTIEHREPGRGRLFFTPDDFWVRRALVAATPHNMNFLVKHYRDKRWSYEEEKWRKKIEGLYNVWWMELDKTEEGSKEKKAILKRETEANMTPFDVPPDYGKKDHAEMPKQDLVQTIANLDETVRKLEEEIKKLKSSPPQGPEKPPKKEVDQPLLGSEAELALDVAEKMDFFVLKAKLKKIIEIEEKDTKAIILAKYKEHLEKVPA
jgi:hypothetical protein